jgi:outer membrane lipoprotein-sorting protein
MKTRAWLAIASALLLGAPHAAGAGAATDAVVEQVLAAYGGKGALAKVKGYRMEGSVTSVMRGTGTTVRSFSRPNRLKIVIDYPGRLETRILDGDRGWRSDAEGKMVAADDFLLTSMVLQAARADLPWLLDERRSALVALPPMEGGKLQGLEIALGQGLALTVYVETATGRIVRSSGVLSSPAMKTNFATDYSDFRTVDGILFPFREANFASNQSTGETVITKVAVNPPLTDSDFRP